MMKFTSRMAEDLKNMIDLKVATNHHESTYLARAMVFDRFCNERFPDEDVVTEAMVLTTVKDALDKRTRNTAHSMIAYIRIFATYQRAIGKKPFIPSVRMLSGGSMFIPYILSDQELSDLFHEIDSCNKDDRFMQMLLSTYFRMTYTCGLRPYEARTLKRINVDLDSGELRIINTKWNRSRTIIMSDDMRRLAQKYAMLRDHKYHESELFFPSSDGSLFSAEDIQRRFKKFYASSRPEVPKELLPAVRVYDLRHRFATAVMSNWLDMKIDINARLPYLQAYMGHNSIESTVYYIHLLPENLARSSGIDWDALNSIVPEVEPWEE